MSGRGRWCLTSRVAVQSGTDENIVCLLILEIAFTLARSSADRRPAGAGQSSNSPAATSEGSHLPPTARTHLARDRFPRTDPQQPQINGDDDGA